MKVVISSNGVSETVDIKKPNGDFPLSDHSEIFEYIAENYSGEYPVRWKRAEKHLHAGGYIPATK